MISQSRRSGSEGPRTAYILYATFLFLVSSNVLDVFPSLRYQNLGKHCWAVFLQHGNTWTCETHRRSYGLPITNVFEIGSRSLFLLGCLKAVTALASYPIAGPIYGLFVAFIYMRTTSPTMSTIVLMSKLKRTTSLPMAYYQP